jgi:hypothetical protein
MEIVEVTEITARLQTPMLLVAQNAMLRIYAKMLHTNPRGVYSEEPKDRT